MKDKLQKILLQPKWIVLIFVCVMYCIPQITKLGFIEGTAYENNEIPFEKGDMLFLYTDGVTEARDKEKNLYGEERLKACIEGNHKLKAADLLKTVREDVDKFANGAEQFDDITMVAFKMGN